MPDIITHKNLTIIFGDKQLSCESTIPQSSNGIAPLMNQEPFTTLSTMLGTDVLVFPHQTHSTDTIVIESADGAERYMNKFYDADIVITTAPDIAVGVLTADCLPLILFDKKNRVLAAVHAGWRGTVKNVADVAIKKMVACGAQTEHMTAYFGPCAHVETYEAGPELIAALVTSPHRDAVLEIRDGKTYFNLPRMNELQLFDAGMQPAVISYEQCLDTLITPTLWSYRRDGEKAKRQPSIAVFR